MPWQKLGHVFCPAAEQGWNVSHAQVPVVDASGESRWRIYYGTRDGESRTHTSFIEVQAGNPTRVLYVHPEPILPLGEIGTFDDCGVMPSWVVDYDQRKYLYYIGWTVRNTVPYHNSIGLAVSEDGGRTFRKYSTGPIFSPTVVEPYFTGTSCVLVEGGTWKNWYLSCTKWEVIDGRPEPFYNIKYAESSDGINWVREGTVAIDYASADEGGLVKASVLRDLNGYRMWYSHRHARNYRTDPARSYRIGYAESADGIQWRRLDGRAGIDVSSDGWDAQMLCYPHVIDHSGQLFMIYNGNGFGRTGFGAARWVD